MHKTSSRAFFLAAVIDMEDAETDTSFLAAPDTYLNSVTCYCS